MHKYIGTKKIGIRFLNHNKYSTDFDLLIVKVSNRISGFSFIFLFVGFGFAFDCYEIDL